MENRAPRVDVAQTGIISEVVSARLGESVSIAGNASRPEEASVSGSSLTVNLATKPPFVECAALPTDSRQAFRRSGNPCMSLSIELACIPAVPQVEVPEFFHPTRAVAVSWRDCGCNSLFSIAGGRPPTAPSFDGSVQCTESGKHVRIWKVFGKINSDCATCNCRNRESRGIMERGKCGTRNAE
jgi:hypothetical protein